MTMTARFAGTCIACRGRIEAGALINWIKGQGATHKFVSDCRDAKLAADERAAQPAVQLADASRIASFINAAKERGLQYPKVRFLAPDGRSEMRLSVGTERSRTPGAIFVVIAGNFIGRILTDGRVEGQLAERADVLATLDIVASDPAAAAKAYGALMCRCSFCNLPLTDEGSVEVGYGPVCAKRFGLPHAPKGTPDVQKVEAAA